MRRAHRLVQPRNPLAAIACTFAAVLATVHSSVLPIPVVTLYVSVTRGSDSANCSVVSPCATLSKAELESRGVQPPLGFVGIVMDAGVYTDMNCNVQAQRPLVIQGSGRDSTVINCGGVSRGLRTNSSVVLTDLTIANTFTQGISRNVYAGPALSVGIVPNQDQAAWTSTVTVQRVSIVNATTLVPDNTGGAVALQLLGTPVGASAIVTFHDVTVQNSYSVNCACRMPCPCPQ